MAYRKKKNPFGIKRPGRMKNLAKRHGRSLGAEIAHDKSSPDKSLRGAAQLAANFRSGAIGGGRKPRKPKSPSTSVAARNKRMAGYEL